MSDDVSGRNVPMELPHEMKRRVKKNISKVDAKLKSRGGASGFKNQKHVDLMSFNAGAEVQFVEIVRRLIEKGGRNTVPISKVYQEAAYELNVSPQTAKRYLIKHSADRAELRVFGKDVLLNSRYVEEEDEDE